MMQNYAKFDSRMEAGSSASLDMLGSSSGFSGNDGFLSSGIGFVGDILDLIGIVITGILVLIGAFYVLYLLVLAIRKGLDSVLEDLSKRGNGIKAFVSHMWKTITGRTLWRAFGSGRANILFWIVALFALSQLADILSGNSRLLKVDRIPQGYVGVNLADEKVISPGYHVSSPLMSSYFLSPTSTFDFEIAEATSNTEEELNVTLDRRVGFQFTEGERLGFYKQYGAKDIRTISSDIVMPLLLESIKSVVYRYSFKDLSAKSDEIKTATYELAREKLAKKGIALQYMNIIDIRLPKSYLDSKEELLKADNERKLAEAALETQKKQAEKEILKAENEKQIKIVEAEGIAEYNRIVNQEGLTTNGIEMKKLQIEEKKVEKRDGKLPTNMGESIGFLE